MMFQAEIEKIHMHHAERALKRNFKQFQIISLDEGSTSELFLVSILVKQAFDWTQFKKFLQLWYVHTADVVERGEHELYYQN